MKYANLAAKSRDEHGRGASRRLRRSGEVPAIIYGSDSDAQAVCLDHNTIYHALRREEFHTSILNLEVNGIAQKVLLRDFQMHAYRPQVLHLDFQRVNDKEEVQIRIPLHFINEDVSHAVKIQGAHISHIINEVEIRALAKDIPHFIEVDLKEIKIGHTVHLSELTLPEGVKLVNLLRGEDSTVAFAAGIAEEVEEAAATPAVSATEVPTVADEKKTEEEKSS